MWLQKQQYREDLYTQTGSCCIYLTDLPEFMQTSHSLWCPIAWLHSAVSSNSKLICSPREKNILCLLLHLDTMLNYNFLKPGNLQPQLHTKKKRSVWAKDKLCLFIISFMISECHQYVWRQYSCNVVTQSIVTYYLLFSPSMWNIKEICNSISHIN